MVKEEDLKLWGFSRRDNGIGFGVITKDPRLIGRKNHMSFNGNWRGWMDTSPELGTWRILCVNKNL